MTNYRLLIPLLLSCVYGQMHSQGEEPYWLFSLNTPDNIVYAIGHAPRYTDSERGFKEARESGYLKLAFQFNVHVEHRVADAMAMGRMGSKELTSVTTDPEIYERVKSTCVALDSVIAKDGTYILLGITGDMGRIEAGDFQLLLTGFQSPTIYQQDPHPPSWTSSLIATPSKATGIGTGYRIVGENEYLAMKDALINLAASRSVIPAVLNLDYRDNYAVYSKMLSETKVDTTIAGARIINRWYNTSSGNYFVKISTE